MSLKDVITGSATGQTSLSIDWADRLVYVPDLTGALDIWELREETQTSALSVSASLQLASRKSGGFAVVYKGKLSLGEDSSDDLSVAVKIPRDVLDAPNYKYKKRFRSEALVWYSLKHRNVLPFLGIAEPPKLPICFVSPLISKGNVRNFLSENPLTTRLPIIQGIADGLAYLHSQNVIHGDLKGANVLISDADIPLLCDFGLANLVAETEDGLFENSDTILRSGSRFWMAPELAMAELPGTMLSKASDVWSFAMLAVEVLTNCQPWGKRRNTFVIMADAVSGKRPERPSTHECNDALWALISRCWDINPVKRPDITQVCTSVHQSEIDGSSATE